MDTGAAAGATFWDKNAYIGVAGSLGTLALGNQESLFKTEGNAFSAFGASSLLSTTNLFTAISGLGGSWQNTVGYTSPNLSGLTLSAQHSAREGNTGASAATVNGGATAVAANYTAGALGLSAVIGDVRSTNATAAEEQQKAWLLGASYDFGVAKATAQYGQNKFEDAAGDDAKAKFFQLGAVVPVTQAGAVHASYGQVKVEDIKTRQFSLAYHHTLSKRTSVYAGVTYIKDDILGRAIAEDEGIAYAGETKTTAVAVGLRHAF